MSMDYQVAVIGAGIIGASIAAKLAHLGVSVALIEQGTAGGRGASAYSGGLLRLYDSDPLLMALAARSIGLLDDEPFASAYTPALRRTGMLYRAALEELGPLRDAIGQYHCEQYPMRLLDRDQLATLHPPSVAAPRRLCLYEPHAWVGNVRQAAAALAGQVRRNGLLLEHTEVEAIDCRSRNEVRLTLGEATLRCRAVVIATGAWSGQWLHQGLAGDPGGGLEARSIPLARVACDEDWPLPIIDAATHTYGIPLTPRLVQTGCQPRATAALPAQLPAPDARHAADARIRLERLSSGRAGRIVDILPGFDGYTPDGRPLVGFCSAQSPLYLATGLSGVGFKLAPAIAELAAEDLCRHLAGQTPGPQEQAFSPRRLINAPGGQAAQP